MFLQSRRPITFHFRGHRCFSDLRRPFLSFRQVGRLSLQHGRWVRVRVDLPIQINPGAIIIPARSAAGVRRREMLTGCALPTLFNLGAVSNADVPRKKSTKTPVAVRSGRRVTLEPRCAKKIHNDAVVASVLAAANLSPSATTGFSLRCGPPVAIYSLPRRPKTQVVDRIQCCVDGDVLLLSDFS